MVLITIEAFVKHQSLEDLRTLLCPQHVVSEPQQVLNP